MFLAEGYALLDNQPFWMHASDMLAFFSFDGESVTFKLPLPVETPICRVGRRPYVLPLIPELNDDGHFYLLSLNLNGVSLYEISRSTIQHLDLPAETATSFTAEMSDVEKQKSLQHRSGVGEAGAMFHGQGAGDDAKKDDILQYFHRLSTDIDALLNRNPLPLVLAGVDYLIPIYKQASKYAYIAEPYVAGSYTEKDMLTLLNEAWDVMEPHFRQQRLARKEEYTLFASRGQGSDDPETIISTALSGGVDTLFIDPAYELLGTYNPDTFDLTIDKTPTKDAYSLVDEAAKKTKAFGGKVYLVTPETIPAAGASIAATFRYPIVQETAARIQVNR